MEKLGNVYIFEFWSRDMDGHDLELGEVAFVRDTKEEAVNAATEFAAMLGDDVDALFTCEGEVFPPRALTLTGQPRGPNASLKEAE